MFALMAAVGTMAQNDTIYGRRDRYYYSEWYDQCLLYEKEDTLENEYLLDYTLMTVTNRSFNNSILLTEHYINGGMAVKGIAAMVFKDIDSTLITGGELLDSLSLLPRLPEYLMILQGDTAMTLPFITTAFPRHMVLIDSVQWDTASPSVLRLPKTNMADTNDTTEWMTCLVYEAYFPTPITVDSFFYLAGTVHCNIRTLTEPLLYYPTIYTFVREYNQIANDCFDCEQYHDTYAGTYPIDECPWYYWYNLGYTSAVFGPFLPIVDYYQLNVLSNDDCMGTVEGSGRYPAMSTATVRALPKNSYVFQQWSDGLTDNPRQVVMSTDCTLTAIFQPTD